MKKPTFIASSLLFALISVGLFGCQDGTAENIGEDIDAAVQDAGNKIEDACEEVKEGMNVKDSNC